MSYLYFGIESSYGVPNYGCSYALDITNERLEKNLNYEKRSEFMRSHSKDRFSKKARIGGEVISEFTFGNRAWSYLFGLMLGGRTEFSGYEFAESHKNPWGIKIGYLANDLTADSTNFEIVADSSDFDTIDALIINNEFILVSEIASNTVVSCSRGHLGTLGRFHGANDLVYGVSAAVSKSIVMAHRKKTGNFYQNDYTISAVARRGANFFGFSGLAIDKMSINFRTFDTVSVVMNLVGTGSENEIQIAEPGHVDTGTIVNMADVKVCSLNEAVRLRQLHIELQTNIRLGYTFMNNLPQKHYLGGQNTFGMITWSEDSPARIEAYEQNAKKNYSLSMSEGDYRMIVALNNVRISSPSHYHDGSFLIQDSAPMYVYAHPVFLFQFGV